jgi:hypothetical protein
MSRRHRSEEYRRTDISSKFKILVRNTSMQIFFVRDDRPPMQQGVRCRLYQKKWFGLLQ